MRTLSPWTTVELAEQWGITREGVRYYIRKGMLKAWQHATNKPYYVEDQERLRFERDVRPFLRAGPDKGWKEKASA